MKKEFEKIFFKNVAGIKKVFTFATPNERKKGRLKGVWEDE